MHVVQQHLVLEDGLTHSEHDLVNRMYETNTGETGAIANVLPDQQGEPYATAITSDAVVKQVPIGRMVRQGTGIAESAVQYMPTWMQKKNNAKERGLRPRPKPRI